jgi:chaperone required for assembly of F1-ATPase
VSENEEKNNDKPPEPAKVPGRDAAPPLPKRFYKEVNVGEDEGGFQILLDGRPVRTPAKMALAVPSRALAEAIAEEWRAQGEVIDPKTMPLTRLALTAIDAVARHMADVAAEIVNFASSDLLFYRAEAPAGLVELQTETWDPVLAWVETELGARFKLAQGVMPVEQDKAALRCVTVALAPFDFMGLTCLHVMTALTGSALLALAHAKGRLSAQEAWKAAHIDEDWQIRQWGVDAEAAARRAHRWADMQAASRFLELIGKP